MPPWREFNCLIKLHFSFIFLRSLLPKASYSQSLQLIPTSNQPSTTRSETVSKCHIFAKEEKRKNTAPNFLEQFGTSLSLLCKLQSQFQFTWILVQVSQYEFTWILVQVSQYEFTWLLAQASQLFFLEGAMTLPTKISTSLCIPRPQKG